MDEWHSSLQVFINESKFCNFVKNRIFCWYKNLNVEFIQTSKGWVSFHEMFGESIISSNNKGVSLLEIVGPNVDGNHVKVVITDV